MEREPITEVVYEDENHCEPREKKDTTYRQIFALFYKKWPTNWNWERGQVFAAKALMADKGIEECKDALDFYMKHKDEEFCPRIDTPYDLATKWPKLEAHLKRVGV